MTTSKIATIAFAWALACTGQHAAGQKLTVDSTPSHVLNNFSPLRSLGGAVDRVETKAADNALQQPMLNEILNAGWQMVSYRQTLNSRQRLGIGIRAEAGAIPRAKVTSWDKRLELAIQSFRNGD
jgi:hypothetical protein